MRTSSLRSPLAPPLCSSLAASKPDCSHQLTAVGLFYHSIFDYCIAHKFEGAEWTARSEVGRRRTIGFHSASFRSFLHPRSIEARLQSRTAVGLFLSLEFLIIVSRILLLSLHLCAVSKTSDWPSNVGAFRNSHVLFDSSRCYAVQQAASKFDGQKRAVVNETKSDCENPPAQPAVDSATRRPNRRTRLMEGRNARATGTRPPRTTDRTASGRA